MFNTKLNSIEREELNRLMSCLRNAYTVNEVLHYERLITLLLDKPRKRIFKVRKTFIKGLSVKTTDIKEISTKQIR